MAEAYGESFLLVKGGNASLKKLLTNPLLKNHTSFYHVRELNSTHPYPNSLTLRGRLSKALPSGK